MPFFVRTATAARYLDNEDCQGSHKIKLRTAGYRLLYHVEDDILFVTVIAVGKRERLKVYEKARHRMSHE